jgi:multidrug efflux system membrane fusion protein
MGGALALLIATGCRSADAVVESSPPAPDVSVAEVIAKPLQQWQEFTGRLEARESVEVRPRVAGYVDSVHFADGARVKRGQLLFKIDPRPFQAEVNRWSAEVERADSAFTLARLNHDRGQRLLTEEVIPQEAADKLEADRDGARGAWAAATASLQAARLSHEFTFVRAPIDGRVSRALIRPGNLVTSTSLLTTVVSEGPVLAYFDADERTYLELLGASGKNGGRAAQARVFMALANEEGYPHEGHFDFLDNRVDPRTGTIAARAVFENEEGRLTPGLFARLKLVVPESREAVLIEDRAVGTDLGKKFVLLLKPDETLEYREVSLGTGVDGLRLVKQGLEKGDTIVVNGLQRARPGMKVSATRVAMNVDSAGVKQLEPSRHAAAVIR